MVEIDGLDDAIEKQEYTRLQASMQDGTRLDLMVKLHKHSNRLVVFGQDAIVRERHTLPRFFRWSWVKEKHYSAVFLNDPTLYLNDTIQGGWLQGTEHDDYMKTTLNYIIYIAQRLEVPSDNIVFFGASAGGFTSVCMGALTGANVLVDIPQLNLLTYHIDSAKTMLLKTCYGERQSYEVFKSRLSAIELMKTNNAWPKRLWIIQNLCDQRHIAGQLIPFLSELMPTASRSGTAMDFRLFTTLRKSTKRGGHIPADEAYTIDLIDNILDLCDERPEICEMDTAA